MSHITPVRKTFSLAPGEADEDQAKIRQCEIEDVDHGVMSFSSLLGPIDILDGPATAKVNSAVCL
jgi:hypothetical protein